MTNPLRGMKPTAVPTKKGEIYIDTILLQDLVYFESVQVVL